MELTIFISIPMNEKTSKIEDRLSRINNIKSRLFGLFGNKITFVENENGAEEIAPNFIKSENIPIYFLGNSIAFLAQADIAYFDDEFEKDKECMIEYEVAKKYGIPILYKIYFN